MGKRYFGEADKVLVLERLKTGRDGAVEVLQKAPIKSPEYAAAGDILTAIDALALVLSGEVDYFWDKGQGPAKK